MRVRDKWWDVNSSIGAPFQETHTTVRKTTDRERVDPTAQRWISGSRERATEVQVANFRIVENFIMCSFQANTSAFHHDPMCCQAETRAHILLDQQDRLAQALHHVHCLKHLLESLWVQA